VRLDNQQDFQQKIVVHRKAAEIAEGYILLFPVRGLKTIRTVFFDLCCIIKATGSGIFLRYLIYLRKYSFFFAVLSTAKKTKTTLRPLRLR